MKFYAAVIAFALSSTAVIADVPSLTPENYDSMTDGKTVFIKFFAPWCGHCKAMAPDWEKLATDWEGSPVGLVAEVDCTEEGEQLCEDHDIQGFPTIKYGDPAGLEEYEGGRDYEELAEFAKENLKPICSPKNLDLCDDDKKVEIEALMAKTEEEIDAMIEGEEKKLDDAETEFEAELEKLQERYQELVEAKDTKVAEVKTAGLSMMRAVKVFKAKAAGAAKEEL